MAVVGPAAKYAIVVLQGLTFEMQEIASGSLPTLAILLKGFTHLRLELLVAWNPFLQLIGSMGEVAPIALVTIPIL